MEWFTCHSTVSSLQDTDIIWSTLRSPLANINIKKVFYLQGNITSLTFFQSSKVLCEKDSFMHILKRHVSFTHAGKHRSVPAAAPEFSKVK